MFFFKHLGLELCLFGNRRSGLGRWKRAGVGAAAGWGQCECMERVWMQRVYFSSTSCSVCHCAIGRLGALIISVQCLNPAPDAP